MYILRYLFILRYLYIFEVHIFCTPSYLKVQSGDSLWYLNVLFCVWLLLCVYVLMLWVFVVVFFVFFCLFLCVCCVFVCFFFMCVCLFCLVLVSVFVCLFVVVVFILLNNHTLHDDHTPARTTLLFSVILKAPHTNQVNTCPQAFLFMSQPFIDGRINGLSVRLPAFLLGTCSLAVLRSTGCVVYHSHLVLTLCAIPATLPNESRNGWYDEVKKTSVNDGRETDGNGGNVYDTV